MVTRRRRVRAWFARLAEVPDGCQSIGVVTVVCEGLIVHARPGESREDVHRRIRTGLRADLGG